MRAPFGERLDFVVTDSTGVIRIHKNVEWKDTITVSKEEVFASKALRNYGNRATFWLTRADSPTLRKEVGTTGGNGWFPKQDQEDYIVVVGTRSGKELSVPLRAFIESGKPVELSRAVHVQRPLPDSNGLTSKALASLARQDN